MVKNENAAPVCTIAAFSLFLFLLALPQVSLADAIDDAVHSTKRPVAIRCIENLVHTNQLLNNYFPAIRDKPSVATVGQIARLYGIDADDTEEYNLIDAEGFLDCEQIGVDRAHLYMITLGLAGHDFEGGKVVIDRCGEALLTIMSLASRLDYGGLNPVYDTQPIRTQLTQSYLHWRLMFSDITSIDAVQDALSDYMSLRQTTHRNFGIIAANQDNRLYANLAACNFLGIDTERYFPALRAMIDEQ